MKVSRSGFYKWLKKEPSSRELENNKIKDKIMEIYKLSRKTYGKRRLHQALRQQGYSIGLGRVCRLMKQLRIQGLLLKVFVRTTDSGLQGACPNLYPREYKTKGINEVWVSDLTYIRSSEGWVYLCTVMDAHSRKIIGWSLESHMKTELVTKAVKSALQTRSYESRLIFHSDKGSQYRSFKMKGLLSKHSIKQSMTGKDHCFDNSKAESLFATIKKDMKKSIEFKTLSKREVKGAIFEYIEAFYNRIRLHSSLDYLSPCCYESENL